MEEQNDLNLIFFLTFSQKLPRTYYDLAVGFKDIGLTLVPVQFDQLLSFYQGKRNVHIVTIISSLQEKRAFKASLRIINQALLSGKMTFYHFSSFSDMDLRRQGGRVRNYHFAMIPMKIDVLCMAVKRFYTRIKSQQTKWPGGTRAKLPFEELRREK